jgi:hypothetical protein
MQYTLDVMHCEMNLAKNFLKIISGTKDNMKVEQECLNGRPTVKFIVRTSARVRDYLADAFLPVDGFLPSAPRVKKTCLRGPTHASARI